MIAPSIVADLRRMSPGYRPRMLMLGAQESKIPGHPTARSWFAEWVGDAYDELDLLDGDLRLDLNKDLVSLSGAYASVVNIGTIEHCWDIHNAWCNALRAVEVGGCFMSHGPAGGWLDRHGRMSHGVHMTLPEAVLALVELNGFRVEDQWFTQFHQRGQILWLRARKLRHVERIDDYELPLQVRGLAPQYNSMRPVS